MCAHPPFFRSSTKCILIEVQRISVGSVRSCVGHATRGCARGGTQSEETTVTATGGGPIDTREMLGVHRALQRALADAPAQIAAIAPGDTEAAGRLGSYLSEVLWLLHAHHDGEDELLYPLLSTRAPEAASLCARMDEQHVAVADAHTAAEAAVARFAASGDAADGAAASAALDAVAKALNAHLDEEETEVLPLAVVHMSLEEWGALPGHAMQRYQGERIWLPLGLVLEAMDDDVRSSTLEHFPPPVLGMWNGVGDAAFGAEMATIRSGTSAS